MKTLKYFLATFTLLVAYSFPIFAQGDIITAADYMKLFKTDKSLITIDASKAGDFKKSHIKNAINLPNVELNNNKDDNYLLSNDELATILGNKGISADKPIVVYDGGDQKSSSRVYWVLKYLGAKNVKLLHKDMKTFKGARVPLTPMASKAKKTTFTLNVDNAIAGTIAEIKSGKYKTLDARDGNEYAGTTEKSKGHIPGTINISYKELVNDGNHTFKSKAELESLMSGKGLSADDAIIVSCQSGKRAAVLYVVLTNILDYKNVKLFDGSYNEWVKEGNELEK